MIHVYSHTQLESLAQLLAYKIQHPSLSVFESEVVCVSNPIVQRWLSIEIANNNGIEANIDYPLAANLIWKLLKKAGLNCPDNDPLALDALTWKIINALTELKQQDDFELIKHYLDNDEDGIKQWQLANKIADVFDRYQYHRPEALLTESHTMQPWLKALWQSIVADVPNHKIKLIFQFMEWVEQGKINPAYLPKRIHLFSPSFLPKIVFQFFEKLSLIVEVNFYVVSPTNQYWGDLSSPKKIAKARLQDSDDQQYLEVGNPLLSSWGKVGQIFHDQLILSNQVDYIPQQAEQPAVSSVLNIIQQDIFNLVDATEQRKIIITQDDSIKINACHNKMRECQILHDEILRLFEQNQHYAPENILVLTPSVENYAPYIEAVFSPSPHKHYIPWNINDVPIVDEAPIFEVFLQLFDLPEARFKQSELLAYLDLKECQNQFELSADEVQNIKKWIKQSHINWGKNAQHKQQLGLPGIQQNTWQFGLQRMMASYAMGSNIEHDNTISINAINGQEAETLGKLHNFYDTLNTVSQRLYQALTPIQWQKRLNQIIDSLFKEEGEQNHIQTIRNSIEQWIESLAELDSKLKCQPQLVKKILQEKLQSSAKKIAYMSGGVTFSSMKPLRNIPATVIFILGFNEKDYPRKENRPEFDEMAKNAKVGDPSIGDEDRFLFLETLMAAREKLIISYIAFNEKDNSEKLPSLLLSQLIEYIDDRFVNNQQQVWSASIIQKHRLQAFSSYYYQQKTAKSYDRFWLSLLKNDQKTSNHKQWHNIAPIKTETQNNEIQLEDLLYFYKNPSANFVKNHLKLALQDETENTEDNEPISLNGLQQWQIKQQLLIASLNDDNAEHIKQTLIKTGQLPISKIGDTAFNKVNQEATKLISNVNKLINNQGVDKNRPISVAVKLHLASLNISIVGQIENIYPAIGYLKIRPGTAKGGDHLNVWIHYLLMQMLKTKQSELNNETASYLIDDKKINGFNPERLDAQQVENYLEEIVKLYLKGKNQPIALFEQSSFYVAQQIQQGKSIDAIKLNAKWYSDEFNKGDDSDAYIQLLTRDLTEPPTSSEEFIAIIKSIYLPMLKTTEVIK